MNSVERQRTGFAKRILGLIGLAVLVLSYQNCGTDFVSLESQELAAMGKFICAESPQTTFELSYYPFFRSQCATCHAGSTPVNFANPEISSAYLEFKKTSLSRIMANGTNSNHGNGAGGEKQLAALTTIQEDYVSCTGDPGGGTSNVTTARTKPVVLAATGSYRTLTFNLDSDLELGQNSFNGAKLYLQVQIQGTAGTTAYFVARPSLETAAIPVHIKTIRILINGTWVGNATTFYNIDKVVPVNSVGISGTTPTGNLAVSSGPVQWPNAAPTTDTIQLEFELLEPN